jgi:hypothetical protein
MQSVLPGLPAVSPTGNATVSLSGGDVTTLGTSESFNLNISPTNAVTVLPANTPHLALSLATSGLFSGSLVNAGHSVPLHGVILQKQMEGFGFFLGSDAAGSITLTPQ